MARDVWMALVVIALLTTALAQVEGPAPPAPDVTLSAADYRRYVTESRSLAACHERELQLLADNDVLRAQVLEARSVGLEVTDEATAREAEQLQLVRELGERADRAQRRVQVAGALGVVVGVGVTLASAWALGQVAPTQ